MICSFTSTLTSTSSSSGSLVRTASVAAFILARFSASSWLCFLIGEKGEAKREVHGTKRLERGARNEERGARSEEVHGTKRGAHGAKAETHGTR